MKLSIFDGINLKSWGSTTRIAFALAMWSATVLLGLRMSGILNDNVNAVLESRINRCESIAIACAEFVNNGDRASVERVLQYHVDRTPAIIAAKCSLNDETLFQSASHNDAEWQKQLAENSLTCIRIPFERKLATDAQTSNTGFVDITFTPPVKAGIFGFLQRNSIMVTIMSSALNLLGFMVITRRCFRDLDPSKVVPDRVRSAFDTMAEMVLVLDDKNRVAMTNRAFSDCLNQTRVQGRHVDSLPWQLDKKRKFTDVIELLLENGASAPTVALEIKTDSEIRSLKPNVSEIVDEGGVRRGYLVSLDDITILEERTHQLETTLDELTSSKLEIEEQNEQLRYMATRDPMTGCLNRRAFFEKLDEAWKSTQRYRHPLACIMVDVDHFKSINDNHGHGVGDEVLTGVAKALQDTARETDFVCRYGGEEFCILLPHIGVEGAEIAAERFREAIAALEFNTLTVTASLGCSSAEFGAETGAAMIDQADQALYVAKENGRNRVVRFDKVADVEAESMIVIKEEEAPVIPPFPVVDQYATTVTENSAVDELFAAEL